jgi:hypothetical protein
MQGPFPVAERTTLSAEARDPLSWKERGRGEVSGREIVSLSLAAR